MKFKSLAIALSLVTIFSGSAFAQSKDRGCNKPDCQKSQMAGDNNKMYQPREFTDFAMEGILLSVDQQSKVDKLNADMKAKKEEAKEAKKEAREKARECRKDMRKDYIEGMKEILTPDQYVTFLENIVYMPQQPKGFGCHKGQKGPKGKMMNRGERACKDNGKCVKADCQNTQNAKAKK